MERTETVYQAYVQILKEELVPAMGCTEPIALAYCAAKAREVLGHLPDRCQVRASGNIVKNVKSVIVPNTGGLKGIEAACAAGAAAGDAGRVLEVIAGVTEEQKQGIREFLNRVPIQVEPLETEEILDMVVTLFYEDSWARVRIAGYHTNIVLIEKDGRILYEKGITADKEVSMADRSLLSIEGIYDFAKSVCLEDVQEIISRQIACNSAISQEGLSGNWGANIGSTLLKSCGNDVRTRARAAAAAGSDARMSGCEMPVIINSGSGNQGMTASLPVIEYARELESGEEMLYRALILSNLITIHQKTGIGRLSAYCGAVSAGCGAGCGIAFLLGGDFKAIAHTLVNALAIVSGIICDGAKPSCAGKIAAAVDAGILGYDMYQNGQQFRGGDGIISKGVENTITNIGRLGKEGMKETDKEIIRIMTGC